MPEIHPFLPLCQLDHIHPLTVGVVACRFAHPPTAETTWVGTGEGREWQPCGRKDDLCPTPVWEGVGVGSSQCDAGSRRLLSQWAQANHSY